MEIIIKLSSVIEMLHKSARIRARPFAPSDYHHYAFQVFVCDSAMKLEELLCYCLFRFEESRHDDDNAQAQISS